MFAAVLSGLVIYVSCKGDVIGKIPSVVFTPDPQLSEEFTGEVDVTSIVAEDITVEASEISNDGAQTLSTSTADPISAAGVTTFQNISSAVASVVTNSQETYFSTKDESSIRSLIESGNGTMKNNITQLETAMNGNSILQDYMPSFVASSGRVSTESNRIGGEIVFNEPDYAANATDGEITACLEAWEAWATGIRANYKTLYDAGNAKIDQAYNTQKGILDKSKSDQLTAFENTYNTRATLFINIYLSIATNVQKALNAGKITQAVADDVFLMNNIMLGVNLYRAFALYQGEILNVNNKYNTALTKLNNAVNAVRALINTQYKNALDEVAELVKVNTADCHDQGSHDQGN